MYQVKALESIRLKGFLLSMETIYSLGYRAIINMLCSLSEGFQ